MNRYVRSGLMTVAIAAAAALFVVGVQISGRDAGLTMPPEVDRIVPTHEARIGPLGRVGAELDNAYTGVLIIDGTEIPPDQLDVVEALGIVFFNPGPDRVVQRFEPGLHTATIIYWPRAETRAESRSFTWSFRVG